MQLFFQRKGDVLPHRQADELAVRVLQHRADVARQLKNTAVGRIHAVHSQRARALAGVGERVQAVDAGRQRGLAAAGRPGDQHALPGVDVQIDVMQRGLLLGAILEGKNFLKDMIGVLVSAIRHLAGEIVVEQQNAFPRLWEGIRV